MPTLTGITPERIDTIDFMDLEIEVAVLADSFGYIPVSALCKKFSLDSQAQRRKIERNSWYYDEYTENIKFPTKGGDQVALCIRADAVPIFLTTVNLFNVKDKEAFRLLEAFIQENHIVLAEYWGLADREQIMVSRQVIEHMLLEHGEHEDPKKVTKDLEEFKEYIEEKLEQIRVVFSELHTDVKKMKQWVGPTNRIEPEQGAEIQHKIKQLAQLKIEYMGITSPYGAIYASLYKQYGVTSYKEITMKDYPHVLKALDDEMDAVLKTKKDPSSAVD